jgi:U3 small nucleolar RNA-associated protein 3
VPPSGPAARDKKSLLRHLEVTSPETLALAREWADVASDLYEIQAAIKQ